MNQGRALKALLGAFLRMELRNQAYAAATGAKPAEALPPLFWVLGQFLATSMLTSLTLFLRVPADFFAVASLGLTTVLVGSALVVEFHEVAFQPDDALVLGHRPLPLGTYARARLLNLLAYVGLFAVATAIFPSVLGAALFDAGPHFAWAFLLANVAVSLGVAALVVGAFAAFGAGWMTRIRSLLAWVQIAAILVAFYGAQMLLRKADGSLEVFAQRPPDWLWLTPWGALGAGVGKAGAGQLVQAALPLSVGLLIGFSLVALAAKALSKSWAGLRAGAEPAASHVEHVVIAGGTVRVGWVGRLVASRAEAAGFFLARRLLERDGDARLRALPALGLPVSALALGLLSDQLADPFVTRGGGIVLSLSVGVLLGGAVPSLLTAIAAGKDEGAASLFWTAPLPSLEPVVTGAAKAALLRFLGPLFVVFVVAAAWWWRSVLHAGLEGAWALLLVLHAWALAQPKLLDRVPFSARLVRGASMGPVALLGAVCTAFGMGLAAVRYAVGPSVGAQLGLLAVLAVAFLPHQHLARRQTSQALLLRRARGGEG